MKKLNMADVRMRGSIPFIDKTRDAFRQVSTVSAGQQTTAPVWPTVLLHLHHRYRSGWANRV